MKAIPLYEKRALFIPSIKAVVIADLHIGIEYELFLNGVNIPSQTNILLQRCQDLGREKKATTIILLGDVKHIIFHSKTKDYHTALRKERKDVYFFLSVLAEEFEVRLIKGNHDGGLKSKKENVSIYGSKGISIGKFGFVHGHAWPSQEVMESDIIIMAHTHPVVHITNSFGYPITKPCWLKGRFAEELYKKYKIERKKKEIIVMPAFNPLCGGIAINREGILGPLGKIVDLAHTRIYLLDGTYLGYVHTLHSFHRNCSTSK
ncbi:MAG: metallophosphoesterase [Thermoplasmata archaeon]|nr:MAG: metallophosphoesterase [Thermoplasmata archaeon]